MLRHSLGLCLREITNKKIPRNLQNKPKKFLSSQFFSLPHFQSQQLRFFSIGLVVLTSSSHPPTSITGLLSCAGSPCSVMAWSLWWLPLFEICREAVTFHPIPPTSFFCLFFLNWSKKKAKKERKPLHSYQANVIMHRFGVLSLSHLFLHFFLFLRVIVAGSGEEN